MLEQRQNRLNGVVTYLFTACLAMTIVYSTAHGELKHKHTSRSLALPLFPEQIHLFEDNKIEHMERKPEKPPPRIVEEILGGVVGGTILGLVGGGVGYLIGRATSEEDSEHWDILPPEGLGMAIGAGIGYVIGSAVGVHQVRDNENETGNFGAALLGSVAASFLGSLLSTSLGPAGSVAALPASPIGATVGFNMTRRYKTPQPSENGFIDFKDGRMYFGSPSVCFQPDPFEQRVLVQNAVPVNLTF